MSFVVGRNCDIGIAATLLLGFHSICQVPASGQASCWRSCRCVEYLVSQLRRLTTLSGCRLTHRLRTRCYCRRLVTCCIDFYGFFAAVWAKADAFHDVRRSYGAVQVCFQRQPEFAVVHNRLNELIRNRTMEKTS